MSTKEYRKNHTIAWNHFVEIGLIPENDQHNYVLHHIDVDLKYNDPERYDEWRIEDLIPMTKSEHSTFHNKGKTVIFTEKHKRHISENHADVSGENNPMYGKNIKDFMSEDAYAEWKRKISEANKGNTHALGKHWKLSEETKKKMRKPKSELHKQHLRENNASHRQEVRDKIAKSHIGIKPDKNTRKKLSQARKRNALKNFLNSREYAEKETILKLYKSGLSVRQIQFRYDKPTYVRKIINDIYCKLQGDPSNT